VPHRNASGDNTPSFDNLEGEAGGESSISRDGKGAEDNKAALLAIDRVLYRFVCSRRRHANVTKDREWEERTKMKIRQINRRYRRNGTRGGEGRAEERQSRGWRKRRFGGGGFLSRTG